MCIRLPCHSTYHVLSTSSVFSAEFCTSKRSHSDDRREEESNTPVPETGKALRLTTHAVRRKDLPVLWTMVSIPRRAKDKSPPSE